PGTLRPGQLQSSQLAQDASRARTEAASGASVGGAEAASGPGVGSVGPMVELSNSVLVTISGLTTHGSMGELSSSALVERGQAPPPMPDEHHAAALVGQVISERYRVDELIGAGGMGAVYRGEQIHLRKRVAIKVLHPATEKFPELVMRFEREAVAGAHVDHPNVASAIDFGRLEDHSYFLILEYIEGTRLSDLLDRGALPVARGLEIARQMADALAAVHAKGIVHRDIKPANTLLDAQG